MHTCTYTYIKEYLCLAYNFDTLKALDFKEYIILLHYLYYYNYFSI